MSRNDGAPAGQQGRTSRSAGQRDHTERTTTDPGQDDGALFDVPAPPVVGRGAYGPVVRQAEPEPAPPWIRGPGPRPREPRDRDSAARHADPAQTKAAEAAIRRCAATAAPFSSDDIREAVPEMTPSGTAALGGLFSKAAAAGLIEMAGYGPSRSASRRGGSTRLWRGRAR